MAGRVYEVVGLMSGTSLDGLDICYVQFMLKEDLWTHLIHKSETFDYPKKWQNLLNQATNLDGNNLLRLNHLYGTYLGEMVLEFLSSNSIQMDTIDLIASHGHTVFHQPENGFTYQLGNGPEILAKTNITTVCDFRSADVVMGGQGAPLVPIGDELLFGNYEACLNLGGFANISFKQSSQRIAFDICPVNFVLNSLAQQIGFKFDDGGKLARSGRQISDMVQSFNGLPYYQKEPPKSLGAEWVNLYISPIIDSSKEDLINILNSYSEHVAMQIAEILNRNNLKTCLVTGGGAYNQYLLERIISYSDCKLVIPDNQLIEAKEALIFGFMGLLRLLGNINVLASVTGCPTDHSSGIVYGG